MDLTAITFSQNHYAFYSTLRKDGNVHYIEKNNAWLVIGYNEIKTCLLNFDIFTSEGENPFDPILLNCDPPNHTKHRKALVSDNGLFSPNRIDSLEQQNREICRNLLKQVKAKNSFELLSEVAMPFSTLVILNLLGINSNSTESLKEWSSGAVLNTSIYNTQFANEQWNKFKPLVKKWIEEARINNSTFGIASLMLKNESAFLNSENNLLDLVKILLLGGNETTPNLVSSALLILLKRPDLLLNIQEKPELLSDFIYEVLRLEAPTQLIQRTTKTEVRIGKCLIPANATVMFGIGAANRDPDVFPNPDMFDMNRPKEKILSFGYGPHYCLGAQLAKQEAQILLEELLLLFPNLSINPNVKPLYRHSSHVRGLEKLELYVNKKSLDLLSQTQHRAIEVLQKAQSKYGHFASLENYPNIAPTEWYYTYPSPFIHANVMCALINLTHPDIPNLLKDGKAFLIREMETSGTWRFWKKEVCKNPVPPDLDDMAICSYVLNRLNKYPENKNLFYKNINHENKLLTWIFPSFSLLFKSPKLAVELYKSRNLINPTLHGGMISKDDNEIGVTLNALLYLGENEKTYGLIQTCISSWRSQLDSKNFYDNDLVIAFHFARTYHSSIPSLVEVREEILDSVKKMQHLRSFPEYLLVNLIAQYFKDPVLEKTSKEAILKLLLNGKEPFEPFRYFTSKDRNFYGGSDCLTAAWFLEATQNW